MNRSLSFLLVLSSICFNNSCITAAVSTVAGTVVGADKIADSKVVSGLTSIFKSDKAPEKLKNCSFVFEGTEHIFNTEKKHKGELEFKENDPTIIENTDGKFELSYSRQSDKKAQIKVSGSRSETYKLSFTSSSEGTYTFVRHGVFSAVAEGTFKIR